MKLYPVMKVDRDTVIHGVSCAAGVAKGMCAGVNNAASLWMDDAMDVLKQDKRYCREIKKAFGHAVEVRRRYEQALLCPPAGELRYFDTEQITSKYRSRFKENITTQEYFDFWQAVGGTLYFHSLPLIKALLWKYERIIARRGVPDPHTLAVVITAETLMVIAVDTFETTCRRCDSEMPMMNRSAKVMFSRLSFAPVRQAWGNAVEKLIPNLTFDKEEERDLTVATRAIIDMWEDPDTMMANEDETMQEYGTEVFRDKRTVRDYHSELDRRRNELRAELNEIKLKALKEQYDRQ